MTLGVAAAGRFLADCKRFFWRSGSDYTLEYANNLVSLPRCGGLEFSYCHFLEIAVVINSLAISDCDDGFLVVRSGALDDTCAGVA